MEYRCSTRLCLQRHCYWWAILQAMALDSFLLGRKGDPFPHLPGFRCYTPGQKSLGQYWNIHIFLLFLGSLLKQYSVFEIFLQFSLPPPYKKLKLGKKVLDTRVQHCLWGEGRGWTCLNWKTPRNAKVSQDFCPWWSQKEVGREKAVFRGFQACKSVFSWSWWKIVIDQIFSQLFEVFWTWLKNSLGSNDIHQKLWNLITHALF